MSAICVNLLSSRRYRAVRRREVLRPWWMVIVGVIGLAVLAWAWLGTSHARLGGVSAELSVLRTSVSTLEEQGKAQEERLARLKQQELAAQAVGDHPNWSVLFSYIARSRGDEIVLERCDISPVRMQAPGSTGRAAKEYVCTIEGVSISNKAVREYVIRLEESGLFDSVKLEDQQRRSENENAPAITSFKIACRLKEGTEVRK